MKDSKTLTNEELSQRVLDELEDVILSVCNNVVESIDMQLRKGHNFLDYKQKEELVSHLREKVNLNLTINAGIQTKDLASIDIYPRDMLNRGLDSFIPMEEEGKDSVTINREQFEKLEQALNTEELAEDDTIFMLPGESLAEYEERKLRIQTKVFTEERRKRAGEQA